MPSIINLMYSKTNAQTFLIRLPLETVSIIVFILIASIPADRLHPSRSKDSNKNTCNSC